MKKASFVLLAIMLSAIELYACTSAIFSGRCTPDGRPVMWKNRDIDVNDNRMEYFKGEKYNFLALVNSNYTEETGKAWIGTNDAGFCIMNTASYNLKDDDVPEEIMFNSGKIMFSALSKCENIADFEKMLSELPQPIGAETNFGVIDAEGGAAYFEVNNNSWQKIDVNDPKVAPQGYLVYANFSYTGRLDEGAGYVRYTNADIIIKKQIARNADITPEWIFSSLSRSFYNSVLDVDLRENLNGEPDAWFIDQDFIPRNSSTAAAVIKGVKAGEDPMNSVMWAALGYPPTAIAVPMFIKAGENQPSYMLAEGEGRTAAMCDMALDLKSKVFPIERGNGQKYLHFGLLYNRYGTGYIQELGNVEAFIFEETEKFIEEGSQKYNAFYKRLWTYIEGIYSRLIE